MSSITSKIIKSNSQNNKSLEEKMTNLEDGINKLISSNLELKNQIKSNENDIKKMIGKMVYLTSYKHVQNKYDISQGTLYEYKKIYLRHLKENNEDNDIKIRKTKLIEYLIKNNKIPGDEIKYYE